MSGKGGEIMKCVRSLLTGLFLIGSLGLTAGIAAAQMEKIPENVMRPGVIYGGRIPGANICHLMFPTISMETLFTNQPTLNRPTKGSLIDYYGRCDYDPLGPEEVRNQREDFNRRLRDER
jgi:hypothetical protein